MTKTVSQHKCCGTTEQSQFVSRLDVIGNVRLFGYLQQRLYYRSTIFVGKNIMYISCCWFAAVLVTEDMICEDQFYVLIRPPGILVGRLRFYLEFFFSPSTLQAHWTKHHQKPATCSEVSVIWKCMSEIWGIPSPTNQGAKNTFFNYFATWHQL